MRISAKGEALIMKWEGLYLKAYIDPVGILTIGYGTISNGNLGIKVYRGQTITKAQAIEYMRIEIRQIEKRVLALLKVPVTQYEFDAIVSFVYNLGIGNFSRSSLLKLINEGRKKSAAGQFARWTYATDRRTKQRRQLKGLVFRRKDERAMFEGLEVTGLKPLVIENTRGLDFSAEKRPATETASEMAKDPSTVGVGGGLVTVIVLGIEDGMSNPLFHLGLGILVVSAAIYLYIGWRNKREYIDPEGE